MILLGFAAPEKGTLLQVLCTGIETYPQLTLRFPSVFVPIPYPPQQRDIHYSWPAPPWHAVLGDVVSPCSSPNVL